MFIIVQSSIFRYLKWHGEGVHDLWCDLSCCQAQITGPSIFRKLTHAHFLLHISTYMAHLLIDTDSELKFWIQDHKIEFQTFHLKPKWIYLHKNWLHRRSSFRPLQFFSFFLVKPLHLYRLCRLPQVQNTLCSGESGSRNF